MSRRDEKRVERRRAILAGAWACFAARGFHATGMAELAAATGLTAANLYRYFPSKAALVAAIVEQERDAYLAEVARHAAGPDPLEAILAILAYGVDHARDPASARLWLEILAEGGRAGPVRQVVLPFDQQSLAPLEALVRRGIAERRLAADLDPRLTAQWLTALLDGVIARQAMEPDLDLDRWIAGTETLVRRALAPPPARRRR